MAPHSSVLAWKIPRTEEPGGLQSVGLQRTRASLRESDTAERLSPINHSVLVEPGADLQLSSLPVTMARIYSPRF